MKIADTRRANVRTLIEQYGSTKLATLLGYRQPSYLSQLAGPNPTREVTEKLVRRFEEKLGLPEGRLDDPVITELRAEDVKTLRAAASTNEAVDASTLIPDVIRLIGSICAAEQVDLPTAKFADLVALAYADTLQHGDGPRPEYIKQLVSLAR